jgi:ethanolaminephosphotransferase
MDGKQARRTQTSSPMGMLFDHGCDALTTFLFASGLGSLVGLGNLLYLCRLHLLVYHDLVYDMYSVFL